MMIIIRAVFIGLICSSAKQNNIYKEVIMAIERTFSIIKPNAVAKKRYWRHLFSL
ncbi:nucleoside diphosphate kinase [Klebsiella oxytoca]|nr:nucleoside diphosphate kinase [Klebsiella oxytoca]